jgi:hypothetical protein
MPGITQAQAQAQLDLWLAADAAVAQSQSYSIAGRSLTRTNAAEITAKIDYWSDKLTQLTLRAGGRTRSRTIVVGF